MGLTKDIQKSNLLSSPKDLFSYSCFKDVSRQRVRENKGQSNGRVRPRGTKKPIREPLVGKVSQNDLQQPLTETAGSWPRLTSGASIKYLFSTCSKTHL